MNTAFEIDQLIRTLSFVLFLQEEFFKLDIKNVSKESFKAILFANY
jgi:hypothetical protein